MQDPDIIAARIMAEEADWNNGLLRGALIKKKERLYNLRKVVDERINQLDREETNLYFYHTYSEQLRIELFNEGKI
jgi:hypothetical protein